MTDKYLQLNRAKRLALACLVFAASVFILTILMTKFYPSLIGAWWLGLIKMASEAALVGGLLTGSQLRPYLNLYPQNILFLIQIL